MSSHPSRHGTFNNIIHNRLGHSFLSQRGQRMAHNRLFNRESDYHHNPQHPSHLPQSPSSNTDDDDIDNPQHDDIEQQQQPSSSIKTPPQQKQKQSSNNPPSSSSQSSTASSSSSIQTPSRVFTGHQHMYQDPVHHEYPRKKHKYGHGWGGDTGIYGHHNIFGHQSHNRIFNTHSSSMSPQSIISNRYNITRTYLKEICLTKPPKLYRGCPKPMYYYSKNEGKGYIIASTSCYFRSSNNNSNNNTAINRYGSTNGCILKYDILNDSWFRYYAYSQSISPYNHGHSINTLTNDLYLFGGANQILASINLENKSKIKTYDISSEKDMNYWYPSSFFNTQKKNKVSSSDCLMIFGAITDINSSNYNKQLLDIFYNEKKERSPKFYPRNASASGSDGSGSGSGLNPFFYGCKILHNKHSNFLLILNGNNENTAIYKFSLKSNRMSLFHYSLPKKGTNSFDCILLHDRWLIIVYPIFKQIWCLDIYASSLSGCNKWLYKSCKTYDCITSNTYIININNSGYIHFINYIYPQHWNVWIYNMINKKLLKKVFQPIIINYFIKHNINTNNSKIILDNKPFPNGIIKFINDECVGNLLY